MKKLALVFIFILSSIILSGCEEETDKPDVVTEEVKDNYLFSELGEILFKNDYDGLEFVTTDDKHLKITADTVVVAQRNSFSGFSTSTVSSIKIGSIVEYFYRMDDVIHTASYNTITVVMIKVYHPDYPDIPTP